MAGLLLWVIPGLPGPPAVAQLTESFDTLTNAYVATAAQLPSGTWTMNNVFREEPGASRGGVGRAARINDDLAGAHLTTPPLDSAGTVSFYHRELNSGGGTFRVLKSVGGGPFEEVGAQAFGGTDFTFYSLEVNDPSAAIVLRVLNDNQPGHLIVDDLVITAYGGGTNEPPPGGGGGVTNRWDFEDGVSGWVVFSRFSNADWTRVTDLGADGTAASMEINGRNADTVSDDWLISPPLDLSGRAGAALAYWTRRDNRGPDIGLLLSTNYPGAGDPLAPGVSWETLPYLRPAGAEAWVAGSNDLAAHLGETNIHVAFHYTSTGTGSREAARWNVDEVWFTAAGAVPSNAPPVLSPIGPRAAALASRLAFPVVASDAVDGDPVSLTASNLPGGAVFGATNGNGSLVWDNAGPAGVYTSVFHAADKDGFDAEAVVFTITDPVAPTNLPVLAGIGDKAISLSNRLQFAVTASDVDGDAITLTASNLPGSAVFAATNGQGTLIWEAAGPAGVYTSSFHAVDNDGRVSEAILITVFAGSAATGTIVFQGFDGSAADTWSFTGAGVSTSVAARTGGAGRLIGGTEELVFAPVSVAGYEAVRLVAAVAAPPGIENADSLQLSVAVNGAAFPAVPDITLTEANPTDTRYNVGWGYDAAGVAITVAGTPAVFAGDGTGGYARVLIDLPPGATGVSARIRSANSSATEYYYLDDIALVSGVVPFSDAPVLGAVPDRAVSAQNTLTFEVTATDPGGDPVALSASNLPPGAVFVDRGGNAGTFLWAAAGPVGVYTTRFHAVDDDGMDEAEVRITVLPASFTTATTVRVMAANTTSGTQQAYEDPGIRIFQGLAPDIVAIQEFNYSGGLQALVDTAFGPEFHWFVEPGGEQIPNGIISRYPILAAGEWVDNNVANRDFAWAIIDIPGTQDLHLVSVHFLTTGTTERNNQATRLVSFIQDNWDPGALIAVAGDFNTVTRTESAISTLAAVVQDSRRPADQNGDQDTNAGRSSDYDYVLPNPALGALEVATTVGGLTFPDGVVFDSRLWASPPAPVVSSDSGAANMQHMAVMKTFAVAASTEAPTTAVIHVLSGPNGTVSPGTVSVNHGAGAAFTIAPGPGYVIDAVQVDGGSVGAVSSYSFAGVTNHRSLAATFRPADGDGGDGTGDLDGDGLPDWHEVQITGNATGLVAGADDDADGVSNLHEYRAGTQSTNPASFLGVVRLDAEGGSVWLRWQGGTAVTQVVERRTAWSGGSAWLPVFTNAPPTPVSNTYLDASATNAVFYRIVVP